LLWDSTLIINPSLARGQWKKERKRLEKLAEKKAKREAKREAEELEELERLTNPDTAPNPSAEKE